MNNELNNKIGIRRMLFATALIALCFVAIIITSRVESCQQNSSSDENLNKTVVNYATEVPQDFCNEIFVPKTISAFDTKVSDGQNIIGFTLNENLDKATEKIKQLMEAKGWAVTVSENPYVLTFAKTQGKYKWCMFSFTEIDNQTVVVVNVN